MAGFTLLRWATNKDDDEWLARRGTSRLRDCTCCSNRGRAYPWGGFEIVVCEVCISTKSLHAVSIRNLASPSGPQNNQELGQPIVHGTVASTPSPHAPCVACGAGDNTVGHWVRWCIVPVKALQALINDTNICSLLDGARRGPQQVAIATRVVHQFRIMRREAGAMKHQETAPLIDTDLCSQRVYVDLPSDLKVVTLKIPRQNSNCCLCTDNLTCQDRPPLHISSALAPPQVCIATASCETNQLIGVVELGAESLHLIQQAAIYGTGVAQNVKLTIIFCPCGSYHCQIHALHPIGCNEILSNCNGEGAGDLLVQFDGSCHGDRQVGGAGAALYEVQPQGIALIKWSSVVLPECPENIFAEVTSAEVATDLICEEVKKRNFAVSKAHLQGDILPLIKHMAFVGQVASAELTYNQL